MRCTTILIVLISLIYASGKAQKKQVKNFSFKKGEVLDILPLSFNDHIAEAYKKYRETAFPIAFTYSYQPQPSFKITEVTLGNLLPQHLIIGKWQSKEKRKLFLKNITLKVPDFHAQRRKIWTYFGLTYYVMKKDTQFSVDTKNYNVVTSFWKNSNSKLSTFYTQWKKELMAAGGNIIIQLENGTSPLGYRYNPDLMVITTWKNKADFDVFSKNHPLFSYKYLNHVHQFVIN